MDERTPPRHEAPPASDRTFDCGVFSIELTDALTLTRLLQRGSNDHGYVNLLNMALDPREAVTRMKLDVDVETPEIVGLSTFRTPENWRHAHQSSYPGLIRTYLTNRLLTAPENNIFIDFDSDSLRVYHPSGDLQLELHPEKQHTNITLRGVLSENDPTTADTQITQAAIVLASVSSAIAAADNQTTGHAILIGNPLANAVPTKTGLAIMQLAGRVGAELHWADDVDSSVIAEFEPDDISGIAELVVSSCHRKGIVTQGDIISAMARVLALRQRERGENNHRD